jgi:hypothetical protein
MYAQGYESSVTWALPSRAAQVGKPKVLWKAGYAGQILGRHRRISTDVPAEVYTRTSQGRTEQTAKKDLIAMKRRNGVMTHFVICKSSVCPLRSKELSFAGSVVPMNSLLYSSTCLSFSDGDMQYENDE